ncbi:hypothetical protein PVAND_010159 [Polypedilum vanderplanki]|uniref:Alpha 1,4-glycosyltransferase domain-containing protein n=1 Tax=Polypedilum vanderplanki TaxID=319348 RepID=A0A9J6CEQ2_POLVA|nr:hypothetical protein PVAND_010159 [Polypedilum vanderplanki]
MNDEILNNAKQKKIFFIESHTNRDRKLESPRPACSVESAARTNPDMDIYFIFVTDSDGIDMQYSDLIDVFMSYDNIHLRFLNPVEFSKGTILEKFFHDNKLNDSIHKIEHMSDILRVLLLNKYGGQYLDLDVLSLIQLSAINQVNFACCEDKNVVTNAVLNLDLDKGFDVSSLYLRKLALNYKPKSWSANGPIMLTSIVKSFCPGIDLIIENSTKCDEYFTTLPRDKCYPLTYGVWKKMYNEESPDEVLKIIKKSEAIFVHFWNKMQEFDKKIYKLPFTSHAAYIELAKEYCPSVYKTLERYFK